MSFNTSDLALISHRHRPHPDLAVRRQRHQLDATSRQGVDAFPVG